MGSNSFLVIEILKVMAVNARGMVAWVKHAAMAMIEGGVKGSMVCTAVFLASEDSEIVTGHNLAVDGGFRAG